MIETWNVTPPEPKRHIVHIAKLDMDLFSAPVIAASPGVHTMRATTEGVELEWPGLTNTASLSASTPYLVTFSDGQVARCGRTTLLDALTVLGQTWEEGS